VSTSLIRIDRMAIPVAGRTWGGSKADVTPTVKMAVLATLYCDGRFPRFWEIHPVPP
jgi:hypothetical protein